MHANWPSKLSELKDHSFRYIWILFINIVQYEGYEDKNFGLLMNLSSIPRIVSGTQEVFDEYLSNAWMNHCKIIYNESFSLSQSKKAAYLDTIEMGSVRFCPF